MSTINRTNQEIVAEIRARAAEVIRAEIPELDTNLRTMVKEFVEHLDAQPDSDSKQLKNVAREILAKPETLAAIEAQLGANRQFGYVGHGQHALALSYKDDAGNLRILRITDAVEGRYPESQLVLKPLEEKHVGAIQIQTNEPVVDFRTLYSPEHNVLSISEARQLEKDFDAQMIREGLVLHDSHDANYAVTSDGRFVTHDLGAVRTMDEHRAHLAAITDKADRDRKTARFEQTIADSQGQIVDFTNQQKQQQQQAFGAAATADRRAPDSPMRGTPSAPDARSMEARMAEFGASGDINGPFPLDNRGNPVTPNDRGNAPRDSYSMRALQEADNAYLDGLARERLKQGYIESWDGKTPLSEGPLPEEARTQPWGRPEAPKGAGRLARKMPEDPEKLAELINTIHDNAPSAARGVAPEAAAAGAKAFHESSAGARAPAAVDLHAGRVAGAAGVGMGVVGLAQKFGQYGTYASDAKVNATLANASVASDAAGIGMGALEVVKGAGKIKGLGVAGAAAGVVSGGIETSIAIEQGDGRRAARTAGATAGALAGGLAGAAAGAKGGAVVGAAIGVWFGGVGAAPGAAVGAVVGGLVGGGLGAWAGSEAGGSAGEALGGESMQRYLNSNLGKATLANLVQQLNQTGRARAIGNHDSKATEAELKNYLMSQKDGKALDANHDGKITGGELQRFMESHGDTVDKVLRKEVSGLIGQMNSTGWATAVGNHDNKATINEVMATLNAHKITMQSLDKNNDGRVSGGELQRGFEAAGIRRNNGAARS